MLLKSDIIIKKCFAVTVIIIKIFEQFISFETLLNSKLEIGHIGMRNVRPKGSMRFALKLGQNWQE